MNWLFRQLLGHLPPPRRRPEGHPHPRAYVSDPTRADVFDPAVVHYADGFRKGPPSFESSTDQATWQAARVGSLRHALEAIASSALAEQLVVRGSMTLVHWFGERARPPRDIDLIVLPESLGPPDPAAQRLIAQLGSEVCDRLMARGEAVEDVGVTIDSIWTYARAEGRRIAIPWSFAGVAEPLQIDVVFREPLHDAPVTVPSSGGTLQFASQREQLAWKVLWLATDPFPQGKDLYDALLLAEHVGVSENLLDAVFRAKGERWSLDWFAPNPTDWRSDIDWDAFSREYSTLTAWVTKAWQTQLAANLTLEGGSTPSPKPRDDLASKG